MNFKFFSIEKRKNRKNSANNADFAILRLISVHPRKTTPNALQAILRAIFLMQQQQACHLPRNISLQFPSVPLRSEPESSSAPQASHLASDHTSA